MGSSAPSVPLLEVLSGKPRHNLLALAGLIACSFPLLPSLLEGSQFGILLFDRRLEIVNGGSGEIGRKDSGCGVVAHDGHIEDEVSCFSLLCV